MGRSERAVLAVAVAALAGACNVFAGLDGFQKVPCDDDVCDATVDAPESGTLDEPDVPFDATGTLAAEAEPPTADVGISGEAAGDDGDGGETDADADADAAFGTAPEAGVTIDRTWARWVMPNPTGDLDAGADAGPQTPRYDASQSGVVRDLVTGLIWTASTQPATSLEQARAGCALPWRVPTRIELITLLDLTRTSKASPVFTFGTAELWTQSLAPGDAGAWTVSFASGKVTYPSDAHGSAVACVQGGP